MNNNISKLRNVLKANAAFSVIGGLVAVTDAPWVSEQTGIDHVAVTRVVGVGLLVFAPLVAMIVLTGSRTDTSRLIRDSLLVSINDFLWVAATIVVLATVELTTAGIVVALLLALMVTDFGVAQLWYRSKLVGSKETAIVAA